MTKEYFSHDIDALSDVKIVKMMQDYDFMGFGWYWAIVAELYRNGGKYEFSDLAAMAKCTGIKRENLSNFIDKCINKYTYQNQGLFSCDENSFWSDSLLKRLAIRNKRREAAKQVDKTNDIKLDGVEIVRLTEKQYKKIVESYGEDVALEAVKVLDKWLAKRGEKQKGYIGRNNYGHFRSDSWVFPIAIEICEKRREQYSKKQPNWSV